MCYRYPPKKEKPKESYGYRNFLKDLEDGDLILDLTYIQGSKEVQQEALKKRSHWPRFYTIR